MFREVRERVHNDGSLEDSSQQLEAQDSDEEQIRVHKQRNILPEDEEFMRDFDRLMTETIQVNSGMGQVLPCSWKNLKFFLRVPPNVFPILKKITIFFTKKCYFFTKNGYFCLKNFTKKVPP